MFRDIDNCIFADDIAYVSKTGVIVGYPDKTFKPNQPITRGELAAVIHRTMLRDGVFMDVLPYVMPFVVEIRSSKKLGSGVYVYGDDVNGGYILTCRHVVEGSENLQFTIITYEGKSIPGTYKTVSAVPNEDLALIITDSCIPGPRLFLGSPVVQGQPVAVIGSPLGLRENVTVGIVSNISRHENSWFGLDAPINPGNSGGPIVNERSELVGLAVAKIIDAAMPEVGVEGLGYGIKLEIIKKFLNRIWPDRVGKIPT